MQINKDSTQALLLTIAVVADIGGVIAFVKDYPTIWTYASVFSTTVVLVLYWVGTKKYRDIRAVLKVAERIIRESGEQPELLIAFDRSSAIFASMLAQRLGIGQVLTVPRDTAPPVEIGGPRQVRVGHEAYLIGPPAVTRSAVIVFHLRTGSTLEAGLRCLESTGVRFSGNVIAIYATAGGRARFPQAVVVKEVSTSEAPNENFPWVDGRYVHK